MNHTTRTRGSDNVKRILAGLALISILLVSSGENARAAQAFGPVTTTVSIPFSGTLKTDVEDISVTGTLHLRTEAILTQTTVFAEVESNVSNTTGVGVTSGQTFVAVGAALQMCHVPVGRRSSAPVSLDVTSQFRLVPTGPPSPLYPRGAPQRALLLLIRTSFSSDGNLVGANAEVGDTRTNLSPAQTP